MIVYKGFPTPYPGKERGCVWVDAGGPHILPNLLDEGAPLDWGMDVIAGRRLPRSGSAALAYTLCAAVVEEAQARRVYQRFRVRHIDPLPVAEPWMITQKQIREWIAQIEADGERDRRAIARAPQEHLRVERETGPGLNGLPVKWDTDDEGRPIPTRDPDDFTWNPAPFKRPGT